MITKGDMPIDIRWILNSAPIVSGENGLTIMRMNTRTSALNIESIQSIHRGVYKCIAKNKAGMVELSAELSVNGLNTIFSFYFYFKQTLDSNSSYHTYS